MRGDQGQSLFLFLYKFTCKNIFFKTRIRHGNEMRLVCVYIVNLLQVIMYIFVRLLKNYHFSHFISRWHRIASITDVVVTKWKCPFRNSVSFFVVTCVKSIKKLQLLWQNNRNNDRYIPVTYLRHFFSCCSDTMLFFLLFLALCVVSIKRHKSTYLHVTFFFLHLCNSMKNVVKICSNSVNYLDYYIF